MPSKKKSKAVKKNQYEIDDILDDREVEGTKEYFVHWKGYSNKYNEWVTEENCNSEWLVDQYHLKKAELAKTTRVTTTRRSISSSPKRKVVDQTKRKSMKRLKSLSVDSSDGSERNGSHLPSSSSSNSTYNGKAINAESKATSVTKCSADSRKPFQGPSYNSKNGGPHTKASSTGLEESAPPTPESDAKSSKRNSNNSQVNAPLEVSTSDAVLQEVNNNELEEDEIELEQPEADLLSDEFEFCDKDSHPFAKGYLATDILCFILMGETKFAAVTFKELDTPVLIDVELAKLHIAEMTLHAYDTAPFYKMTPTDEEPESGEAQYRLR